MPQISSAFKKILVTVLRNHDGVRVREEMLPNSVEEVEKFLEEKGYVASFEIALTLYLAFKEYRPLLLEGPPGTGKTFLALTVANALGFTTYRIQCFEGMTFEDLVGTWNFQKQLLALRRLEQKGLKEKDIYTMEFFRQGKLLEAVLDKKNNVILIDEFDKTDHETEAFFLEYLGERTLTIPEFKTIKQESKSYVFLTSNEMRPFSEPLLRRCLYLYIEYPTKEVEMRIIKANVPDASPRLIKKIVDLVNILRDLSLEKPPSPTEAIDFARTLLRLAITELDEEILQKMMPILIKTRADREVVTKELSKIADTLKLERIEDIEREIPSPVEEYEEETEEEVEEEVEEYEEETEEEDIKPPI